MLKWVFLALGLLWAGIAAKDYLTAADTDGFRVALQGLLLAALNFVVAFYLSWRQDRRAKRKDEQQ